MASATTELTTATNQDSTSVVKAEIKQEFRQMVDKVLSIDRFLVEVNDEISRTDGGISRAAIQAAAIAELEDRLTDDIMSKLIRLQDNPLGFKTDRPPGARKRDGSPLPSYDPRTVKRVLITGFLMGYSPVGNEINIIAGQCYPTKNAVMRKLRETRGFGNFKQHIGIPKPDGNVAKATAWASWTIMGKEERLEFSETSEGDFRLVCRYHQGSDSPDSLRGKIESKLWKAVAMRVSGMQFEDDPSEETSSGSSVVDSEPTRAIEPPEDDIPATEAERVTESEGDEFVRIQTSILRGMMESNPKTLSETKSLRAMLKSRLAATEVVHSDNLLPLDAMIDEFCDAREEEIRSRRGQRANNV